MTITNTASTRQHAGRNPGAVAALYLGLLLTALATVAPWVDQATTGVLAHHVRAGYPGYSDGQVESAVARWLAILTVVGVLGTAGWVGSIWAVRVGKPWARWLAVALFLAGAAVALAAVMTRDTSGDVGLAPQLGLVGVLPSLAGAVAVVRLFRAPVSLHSHGHR